jgi:exopolysaccharide biosynthesis WecB/TagA/CpsF family protein
MAELASAAAAGGSPRPKTAIAGVPISSTSYEEVLEVIGRRPVNRALVIAVCNVHSVMSARRDAALYDAISQADIATSDGVPLVWLLRLMGRPGQTRVYGPDLMKLALQSGVARGWRHYLYGTTPPTLDRLRSAITRFAPGAVVVGQIAPPFRDLTPAETDAAVAELAASNADIVWVGLGMAAGEVDAPDRATAARQGADRRRRGVRPAERHRAAGAARVATRRPRMGVQAVAGAAAPGAALRAEQPGLPGARSASADPLPPGHRLDRARPRAPAVDVASAHCRRPQPARAAARTRAELGCSGMPKLG